MLFLQHNGSKTAHHGQNDPAAGSEAGRGVARLANVTVWIVRCAILVPLIPALMSQIVEVTHCTRIGPRYGVAMAHRSILIIGDRAFCRSSAAVDGGSAGDLPARRAKRLDPIEALRVE